MRRSFGVCTPVRIAEGRGLPRREDQDGAVDPEERHE